VTRLRAGTMFARRRQFLAGLGKRGIAGALMISAASSAARVSAASASARAASAPTLSISAASSSGRPTMRALSLSIARWR
jgi:hypothetical protein